MPKITKKSFEIKELVGVKYLSLKKTIANYYNINWLTIEPTLDGKFCVNSDEFYEVFDTVNKAIDFLNFKLK